jgi:ABC-type transporter MlaC component
MTNEPRSLNGKTALLVLQFVLPLIIAIAGAYGTVRYTAGEQMQRIDNLERQIKADRDDLNKIMDRQITREEFKQFIDATRNDLSEIKTDIREARKGR